MNEKEQTDRVCLGSEIHLRKGQERENMDYILRYVILPLLKLCETIRYIFISYLFKIICFSTLSLVLIDKSV